MSIYIICLFMYLCVYINICTYCICMCWKNKTKHMWSRQYTSKDGSILQNGQGTYGIHQVLLFHMGINRLHSFSPAVALTHSLQGAYYDWTPTLKSCLCIPTGVLLLLGLNNPWNCTHRGCTLVLLPLKWKKKKIPIFLSTTRLIWALEE